MPRAILFDLNGTLLDTRALNAPLRAIFGPDYSVDQWFHQLILYAMATSATGAYRDFGDIATAALSMAGSAQGIEIPPKHVQRFRAVLKEMPPFPEVKRALAQLRRANFRLAVLSNSGSAALEEQLENAGIRDFFERVVSVEEARRFKPSIEPYQAASRALGCEPQDVLMVAAHHWDLMGASNADFETAFLRRPGQALFPAAQEPDYVAQDLRDLARQLLDAHSAPQRASRSAGMLKTLGLVTVVALGTAALFKKAQ